MVFDIFLRGLGDKFMTNNDVLRRIRYILDYDDEKMLIISSLGGKTISVDDLIKKLKKSTESDFLNCSDSYLAAFLNGLIIEKRGKKEGLQPLPEKKLNNNMIFTKLKIAFHLKSDDILEILSLADFELSSHELSSFFRKRTHKNYREYKDQILRYFLKGLQLKYRNPDAKMDKLKNSVWKSLSAQGK